MLLSERMIDILKKKRAQSGMEYLITYGWAILLLGIIILLILSLRVLDVDWWSVQNDVWMLSSFSIPDFKATQFDPAPTTTSVLLFQLINDRGTNVTILNITVRDSSGNDIQIGQPGGQKVYAWYCPGVTCSINATAFPINMTSGERLIINGTIGMPGDLNTVFTTKIQINYTTPRSDIGMSYLDTGMIRGRIEPQ